MAKSFAETHPHNPNATCECEHWQSCIDCHPTAHGEKYITDAMRVRQAVAQAVLQEPVEYQYRTRPDWIAEWNGWNICSKESAEAYEKTPYLHDWHYEVRRLYTTPPQRIWVGLTEQDLDYLCNLAYTGDEEFALAVQAKLMEKNA